MTRRAAVAGVAMAVVAAIAHWTSPLHLLAGGLALVLLAAVALTMSAWRRRRTPEDLEGYLDEAEEVAAPTALRDGLGGLALAGLGLALGAVIYSYALPPFYPLLMGDCSQLLGRLAIYEEAQAWPRAVAAVDERLARPIDEGCARQLAEAKCRYLVEWSKALPREQADAKLQEAEAWAQANDLPNYGEIARLMRAQLVPTPGPTMVTATPPPSPTPRALPAGTTAQVSGLDLAYFPPTAFVYLRVADGAGTPIDGLTASDLRAYDDGQLVESLSLSQFRHDPVPIQAVLVIDSSGSMGGEPLASAKAGARAFLDLLSARDRVEVIGFSDKAQVLQAWTGDRALASQALDSLEAGGNTALWDALCLAGGDLAGTSGRKVVVLLSDGGDNRSQHSQADAIAQAQRAGLSVFVIGLRSQEYDGAALRALVAAVGGRYAEASAPAELEEYYRQTAGAIRDEYRLALTLPRRPDGQSHRLRLEIGGPQPLVVEQAYND